MGLSTPWCDALETIYLRQKKWQGMDQIGLNYPLYNFIEMIYFQPVRNLIRDSSNGF